MKQLVQNFKTGELRLEEVPEPEMRAGGVLVRTLCSVISAGTERNTIATAQASLVGKARKRPDLVRQVLDNLRREGLWQTYQKVKTRLDAAKPLGYSAGGVVVASRCPEFQPGNLVACAGAEYANHAEVIFVPRNLCARIPQGKAGVTEGTFVAVAPEIKMEEAAFATLGAIALESVRRADVRLGERVVVIGLGLLGLLTAGILKAAGCRVLGADLTPANFGYAEKMGCDRLCLMDDLENSAHSFTDGYGADAVILAAATTSSAPIAAAGAVSRKRGTVVVLGGVGMNIPRDPHYYKKELQIRLSTSYGPGRYDPDYEEKGQDYPFGYVRWTLKRNMEAFLELLAQGKLPVGALITHRFPLHQAFDAYDLVLGKKAEPYLGVVLTYRDEEARNKGIVEKLAPMTPASEFPRTPLPDNSFQPANPVIGFIGAGNFAQAYLLPQLQKQNGVIFQGVCNSTGLSAKLAARKFGFLKAVTSSEEIFQDPAVNVVFIATRHNSHARLALEALQAGKDVFLEKPLCINPEELDKIIRQIIKTPESNARTPRLMMGFNRRFAPLMGRLKDFITPRNAPLFLHMRINAGFLPPDHWAQDPEVGGGRIIGEACHFVDTARFLVGQPLKEVLARALPCRHHPPDTVTAALRFQDGSLAVLEYLGNGDPGIPKEYYEVHTGGKSAILEDFRTLALAHHRRLRKIKKVQDKGHRGEIAAFINAIKQGQPSPIPLGEIIEASWATFAIMESLQTGAAVPLSTPSALELEVEGEPAAGFAS
jgi:polar amino acid transport system substrate-binding protein